jgi:hypothetical protein
VWRGASLQLPPRVFFFVCFLLFFVRLLVFNKFSLLFLVIEAKTSIKVEDEASPLIRFCIFMFCSYDPNVC